MTGEDLFSARKNLDEICKVPGKIISVYSLDKHVWADSNAQQARKQRKPELQTIREFQVDPVRPFLNDIFRMMAAPYYPERKDNPIGQGYWVQAEFGSGKSHLLSFISALALGDDQAWELVKEKEEKKGRGKRDSIYRFWEEGLKEKKQKGKKGIFVVVKTLVGVGSGTPGIQEKGSRLVEYILNAVKEQLQVELDKNISLYPVELLADRFIKEDLHRYRQDLREFLKDPKYFADDEFEEVDEFIKEIQENKSPEYKRSCGNKLWRFYTEYLKVQPYIAAENEHILKHMVESILNEGYPGVLVVLDEVSLFMKNRDENQRYDDEKTLVVIANRLAKIYNLPVWLVCSAQQAIESKMGIKNILADDRLKLVKLLENEMDYYNIVLSRVREITTPEAINNYYQYYKRGFSWPAGIGEQEFKHFFPFHKPALEVVRDISYELTTTRVAIHLMHQTLKHQVKNKGKTLIRLWELFDETVNYEEDPSGVFHGLASIQSKKEDEYRAYESCKRQIDSLTRGPLKVHRDKAIKIIQTLFLYFVAKTRQQGLTAEEIANSVLIERDKESTADENIQHYEILAENLKKELRQIVQGFDEDNRPRYRFDPVFTGVDPRQEFQKTKDVVEANEIFVKEAWNHLLALGEWPVRTQQMTIDLSAGIKSLFNKITSYPSARENRLFTKREDQKVEINWHGKIVQGIIGMRDFGKLSDEKQAFAPLDTAETDCDFAVRIGLKPVEVTVIKSLLKQQPDPRIILWTPAELSAAEKSQLFSFAAYRKMIDDWQGKESDDAKAVIHWVADNLRSEIASIVKIVSSSYSRGRMDALDHTQLKFTVAGELDTIIAPVIHRVLDSCYESKKIDFKPYIFRKEEGIKVINGIVRQGSIPKNAKPDKNIDAVDNFGRGLKILKKGPTRELDLEHNPYACAIRSFINEKIGPGGMKPVTIYKNFMGWEGTHNFGLSRIMIQVYLLSLARLGLIKIKVNPKAGVPNSVIDYANIADIEFTAKILDSLELLEKVEKPQNWDSLRPYTEVLLQKEIPETHDEALINGFRSELRNFFSTESKTGQKVFNKAEDLSMDLKSTFFYEEDVKRIGQLLSTGIKIENDIDCILFALKENLGYRAYDENRWYQSEVDDLKGRFLNYQRVKEFVNHENDIRLAIEYCQVLIPDHHNTKALKKEKQQLKQKIASPKPYVNDHLKLETELIGQPSAPVPGSGTLWSFIQEYTSLYTSWHDSLLIKTGKMKEDILKIPESEEFQLLQTLENIKALHPKTACQLQEKLKNLAEKLFNCQESSRLSLENDLKKRPYHSCGFRLEDADRLAHEAEDINQEAHALFNSALEQKISIILTPAIQQRLQQGETEPVIRQILQSPNTETLEKELIKAYRENPQFTDLVDRYLKKIVIRKIKLADFKPSIQTVEKKQVHLIVEEFKHFLEQELKHPDEPPDILAMLQFDTEANK